MRRHHIAVPVALVAALAAVPVVGFVARDGGSASAPPSVTMAAPTAEPELGLVGDWPEPAPDHVVADATGDQVDLYDEPGVRRDDAPTLTNPTWEGLPLLFRVLEERDAWLRVQVSMRPNGTTAWIRRDQVTLRTVPNRIEIELSTREIRVFHGEELLWESISVIGRDRTPTPLGSFFVDGWVPLDGGGPYGAGQLSVAGFSEVLHEFAGGVGQIAIHGTNRPELMGTESSNGCIRLEDAKLLELVELAPLGTPVDIIA